MDYKAFKLDWKSFETEFLPILKDALKNDDTSSLITFIKENRKLLTDPYEGLPLEENWENFIENNDVDELGDFAITKYYTRMDEHTIEDWIEFSDNSPVELVNSILGIGIVSGDKRFDPGRMGSYFQSPEMILDSLSFLKNCKSYDIEDVTSLFEDCVKSKSGIYVTF